MKAIRGFMAAFCVVMIWGWVVNIIALVNMIPGPIEALMLLRIVGLFFAPLGAVLGWWL